MPAEWEPHDATWVGWPHNTTDWPGKFGPIPWAFAGIVRVLSRGEVVRILVENAGHEKTARRILTRVGVDSKYVQFFRFPTDRGWTRDSGPMFMRSSKDGSTSILKFGFSAWAKYPEWKKDAKVPERAAKSLKKSLVRAEHNGKLMVLEGGSIDVNGQGTLLTTELCLLNPNRNPQLNRAEIEQYLRDYLGVRHILWLGDGIAGDVGTHGSSVSGQRMARVQPSQAMTSSRAFGK